LRGRTGVVVPDFITFFGGLIAEMDVVDFERATGCFIGIPGVLATTGLAWVALRGSGPPGLILLWSSAIVDLIFRSSIGRGKCQNSIQVGSVGINMKQSWKMGKGKNYPGRGTNKFSTNSKYERLIVL
jgi:hypothetical protein